MGAGADILAAIARLHAEVVELRAELRNGANGHAAPAVAPDSDLDGQYGDPEIRKDPKRWDGPPQAPCKMSECPPEYLDVLAEFKDWQAHKEEEKGTDEAKKKAGYYRRDSARARGWAARKRAAVDEL